MNVTLLTYKELCDDPDRGPLGRREELPAVLTGLFSPWLTNATLTLTAAQLQDDLLLDMGVTVSGGIAVMVTKPNTPGGTMQLLHGLYRHAGARGDPHRGKIFAYLGDVKGGTDVQVVGFRNSILNTTAGVVVPTLVDSHLALFDGDADLKLAPLYAAGAAATHTIKSRKSAFVPAPLLPYVLDKHLTPREALTTLVPVIRDLGIEVACHPLLEFLIVASTESETADKTIVEQASAGDTPELALDVVLERRERLLYHQLPDLRPNAGIQSDPALLGIMNTLQATNAGMFEDLADRRTERAKLREDKTIGDKWPTYVGRLCKLCHVDEADQLPKFWQDAANLKKGGGVTMRSLLQDSVDMAAAEFQVLPPHITVQHASSVTNWLFVGSTEFSLVGGILPFTVTPPGSVSVEALLRHDLEREQTADYTTIMEGNSSITAADARALRSTSAYLPTDIDDADSM